MGQQIKTALDFEKYWSAKLTTLKQACPTGLRNYLRDRGWEIKNVSSGSYVKYKATRKVTVGGAEKIETIAVNPGKSGQDLWTDYKNDPTLSLTRPPAEVFMVVLQAEQKFIRERLSDLPDPNHVKLVQPFIDRPVSTETLGADYKALEPLRKYAQKHFAKEYLQMLEFCPPIKSLFLSRNKALDQLDESLYAERQKLVPDEKKYQRPRPGGGLFDLMQPSVEVYKLKAMEFARKTPDRSMLQWLDRRSMLEKMIQFEMLAGTYGNREKINAFYNAQGEMVKIARNKESEIINGTDTLFKTHRTIVDLMPESGFEFVRSTSGREYFARQEKENVTVISVPRQDPYKFLNHTTGKGGSIVSFIREFMPTTNKQEKQEPVLTATEKELQAVAERHGIKIDLTKSHEQLPNGRSLVEPGRQLRITDNI